MAYLYKIPSNPSTAEEYSRDCNSIWSAFIAGAALGTTLAATMDAASFGFLSVGTPAWFLIGFTIGATGGGALGAELDPAADAFGKAKGCDGIVNDPIIFDLDGDGIETTTVNSGFYVDYAGDGLAEATAWAAEDDGVLVVDSDKNNSIDTGNEVITSATLSTYDTNSDGIINSNDTNFVNLQILKGDGTLETLAEAGIASINRAATSTDITDSNGNTQISWSTYTTTSGATRKYGDYELQANTTYSIETSTVDVSSTIEALPDISSYGTVYSLHQAMARDTNGSLQALVTSFVSATTDAERWVLIDKILTDWADSEFYKEDLVGDFVNAQHLDVVQKFLGDEWIDLDEAFVHSGGGGGVIVNPGINLKATSRSSASNNQYSVSQEAGDFIEQAYINIANVVYSELMVQTVLSDFFSEILISYDSTTDSFYFDLTDVVTSLQEAIATDATSGKELVVEFATALKGLSLADSSNYYNAADANCFYNIFASDDRELKWELDIIGKSYDTFVQIGEGSAKDDAMRITSTEGGYVHSLEGDDVVYGGEGNDHIDACSGNDLVDGGAGDDNIATHNDNDTIYGGTGNDNINGCAGDDVLIGGVGNDRLDGDADNDTYVFNIGDGNDTITDGYGNDKIIFGQGITPDSIFITTSGSNKVINYGDGDSITIIDQANLNVIDLIGFYDGTTYSLYDSSLEHATYGIGENDILTSDTSYGMIYGKAGNDTFSTSASGTHIYYDTAGDENYIINAGDGTVYIDDFAGTDTITFGEGITADDLMFTADEDNNLTIKISVNGVEDTIVVESFFDSNYTVENFVFADGTILTSTDVLNSLGIVAGEGEIEVTGGPQNQTIYGNDLDNKITGGSMDDVIYGDAGDDNIVDTGGVNYVEGGIGNDSFVAGSSTSTYAFNLGDGSDTISADTSGTLVVQFGEGITKDDLDVKASGYNLVVKINGTTDEIIVSNNFQSENTLDSITFADGTSLRESDILEMLNLSGTAGDDVLEGSYAPEVINGYAGNDIINANGGNDTITGGTGNDTISTTSGNSLYIFNSGDGCDTISDTSGNDTINFGEGITKDDLEITASGSDLIISIKNSSDKITMQGALRVMTKWMFLMITMLFML